MCIYDCMVGEGYTEVTHTCMCIYDCMVGEGYTEVTHTCMCIYVLPCLACFMYVHMSTHTELYRYGGGGLH